MALFLLENRDFLGFRMIFKVWLNQIFSNFNTMLWTIKYRLNSITVYFTFNVPEKIFWWVSEFFSHHGVRDCCLTQSKLEKVDLVITDTPHSNWIMTIFLLEDRDLKVS
jgi:hypothetical protein